MLQLPLTNYFEYLLPMQPKLNLIPDFNAYLKKVNRQRYFLYNFFERKSAFSSFSRTSIT